MSERDLLYRVRFDGVDQLSPQLKALQDRLRGSERQFRDLSKVRDQFAKFGKLRSQLGSTQSELADLSRETRDLGRALASTDAPTKKMAAEFERARTRVVKLKAEQQKQIQSLGRLGRSLTDAGYDLKDFRGEQRRVIDGTRKASREAANYRRELARVAGELKQAGAA
ncbi:MAG: hypothetical protein WBF53_04300, partial [Litorimonas sp.]